MRIPYFISLTCWGEDTRFHVQHIVNYRRNENTTQVFLSNGAMVEVEQAPEEIDERLVQAAVTVAKLLQKSFV